MVNEESHEGFSRGHMGWAGSQSQVYLLLHSFRCGRSLHLLGVIFVRGVLQHHLPIRSSWSRVLLRVGLSSPHCYWFASGVFPCSLLGSRHAHRRPPPHVCTVKGLYLEQGVLQFYMRQPITRSVSHETLFGIRRRSLAC